METNNNLLDVIKNNISVLENEISKKLNADVKLDCTLDNNHFYIKSNNLASQTGICQNLFNEFYFDAYGFLQSNSVIFNPHFYYHFNDGGENGNNAIWNMITFNFDTNEWSFGKELKKITF